MAGPETNGAHGANGDGPPIALVLPGGGARGAYEAGALAELLPALERRGERVSIFCGTSVGAINASMLASSAHRPADEVVAGGLAHWRTMRKGDVIRRIVGTGLPMTFARLIGEALELPGLRMASLLDPAPLRKSLDGWIDWAALHGNVKSGRVRAACVVATSLSRGAPVAFVESRAEAMPTRRDQGELHFVPTRIRPEHVRASAAIPLLFPPVEVKTPRSVQDHYIDGGTRLNTPIKPALALGAQRVIVIGFEPFASQGDGIDPHVRPRLADVAANAVDGLLVDQVRDDIRRMVAINGFFAEDATGGPSPAARAYRRSRGRPPYRRVSYALVAPEKRGELGAIAERVFQRRYGGLRGLRAPDYPVISRVLGGRTRSRGELLSFLLFDPEFTAELIEAGRRDARRWLDSHPGFWCSDPHHDFPVDRTHADTLRDEEALLEWRALRRS
jgi:NTE family protein